MPLFGELTPSEAGELTKLIDAFTRVNESVVNDARLAAVEAAIAGKAAAP